MTCYGTHRSSKSSGIAVSVDNKEIITTGTQNKVSSTSKRNSNWWSLLAKNILHKREKNACECQCHREIDLPCLWHPRVIFTREYSTPKPIFLRVFGIPSGNLASIPYGIPFWIWGCRAPPAKIGNLSGFWDMRMQSSSCQSWYSSLVYTRLLSRVRHMLGRIHTYVMQCHHWKRDWQHQSAAVRASAKGLGLRLGDSLGF